MVVENMSTRLPPSYWIDQCRAELAKAKQANDEKPDPTPRTTETEEQA